MGVPYWSVLQSCDLPVPCALEVPQAAAPKWKSRSAVARSALGISASYKPWTSRKGLELNGLTDTERVPDVLDIAFQQARVDHALLSEPDLLRNLWCDVSQNCDRGRRYSFDVPCFTTNSLSYSFSKDCTLTGSGQFRALGWGSFPPPAPLDLFSNHEIRDLSGDAFAVPMACTATMCCYLNPFAPSWQQSS